MSSVAAHWAMPDRTDRRRLAWHNFNARSISTPRTGTPFGLARPDARFAAAENQPPSASPGGKKNARCRAARITRTRQGRIKENAFLRREKPLCALRCKRAGNHISSA